MKLIFIIILFFVSNLIFANELENNEVEVINLHESIWVDNRIPSLFGSLSRNKSGSGLDKSGTHLTIRFCAYN